ncbi:hypothetical protein REC12_13290 [Desulfosporosinus sp. PR]|uniref:hypothetical protein n=1 Tax=Candidatus Desulfosporosinus nitrosoreducens TaxID=3401928 RepID=UPI0027F0839F|nr:hypothetical protein [Desulfosporosinus sp. PR]MDQ7094565.1 hypothetical protein [Desulfosporosinus sp. PR]
MQNSLVMRTEATYVLNFLIYIQNIYFNQSRSEEEYKFPYFPSIIAFEEDFQTKYKDLWNEVSRRITEHQSNGVKIFYDEKDLFYQGLFLNNSDSLKKYSEIYKSFKIWWDSLAGGFSVERSIDVYCQELYEELASLLSQKGIEPKKELNISLIYDECKLVELDVSSYFVVLTIHDFVVNRKDWVSKLLKCIY